MFDVCVIGHITKDIIRVNGQVKKELPGGTVYYTAIALSSFGLKVGVITKTSNLDRDGLLSDLQKKGIAVFWQKSEETTIFENIYETENLDLRVQKVQAIADPFLPKDLTKISAAVFHVGALTNGDVSPEFLQAVSTKGNLVSLDAQGLLRQVRDGKVIPVDWPQKEQGLSYIDILKVDKKEAQILSGENEMEAGASLLSSWGPKEVLITFGSQGSLIYSKGKFYQIPAFPARKIIDPTGCGDTYMAGYISQRLNSDDVEQAGRFAAAVATRKLENFGPLSEWNQGDSH